jgi:hypothetical protein
MSNMEMNKKTETTESTINEWEVTMSNKNKIRKYNNRQVNKRQNGKRKYNKRGRVMQSNSVRVVPVFREEVDIRKLGRAALQLAIQLEKKRRALTAELTEEAKSLALTSDALSAELNREAGQHIFGKPTKVFSRPTKIAESIAEAEIVEAEIVETAGIKTAPDSADDETKTEMQDETKTDGEAKADDEAHDENGANYEAQ